MYVKRMMIVTILLVSLFVINCMFIVRYCDSHGERAGGVPNKQESDNVTMDVIKEYCDFYGIEYDGSKQLREEVESMIKERDFKSRKDMWRDYAGVYTTASKDGYSSLTINVKEDGTFEGVYTCSDKDSDNVEYASFSGTFSNEKLSKVYTSYSFECNDFEYDTGRVLKDGLNYTYTEPFTSEDFISFELYDKGSDSYITMNGQYVLYRSKNS